MKGKILLLEDDQSFGYILSEYLSMNELEVIWVKSGEEALKVLDHKIVDLAILDIMLPGIDGFEVAKTIKKKYSEIPFLFLSAKALKIDKLKGYKLGAYDYITKPVDEELLVAKVKSLLSQDSKRTNNTKAYQLGKYRFEPSINLLSLSEEKIKLTTRESDLLLLLVQHKNGLLERKMALKELWGASDEFSRKSMDVYISHLRKYLAKDDRLTIVNVHGKGFILKEA